MKFQTHLFTAITALFVSQVALPADPPVTNTNAPSPEVTARMTPNENHKALNDIVGNFNYTMKWWMSPEAKAEETTGKSTTKWVLDGRFVQQDITSQMNGQPFQGIGYTGYDNVRKEYQSVWMDNMATGMMVYNGSKTRGNTIAASGTFGCPMTNEREHWFRNELKVKSKNEHTFTMWNKTVDGKEFKGMEINYKRVN